ncbi:MAG: exosortase/archaeosortase family protein [Candidatus Omnitrophica bacterium]|nr:exosortase/archaeosortase family protein [Candidatus Omnitrophota bacterium]
MGPFLQGALPVLLLAYIYYPSFVWMAERWFAKDSYYTHGILIPFVSLYWIFRKRDELAAAPKTSEPWGLIILGSGALLQIACSILRIYFLSVFSLVLILAGTVVFVFGRKVFRVIWFPLLFLVLMIPLPLLAISEITLKMKFFVAEVSAYLINQTGMEAVREGSYLRTPHAVLLVGDPCSGLRSFLTFMCLGLVFAYQGRFPFWKRLIVVASGLPLAILSNVARVYFLGLIGEIYGQQYTQGTIHDVSGWGVFILAFFALVWITHQLEKPHVKN